jgi:hypothetical protein
VAREADVRTWFQHSNVVDEADIPEGPAMAALADLASLYERHGLLRAGETPALWKACPNCERCWAGVEDLRPDNKDGRSGITLPWIGPAYRPGAGLAVVGMNLRDAGGLLREYEITAPSAGDGSQWSRLSGGYRTAHGSAWAYRSTRSAAAVLACFAGARVLDHEDPQELVGVLDQTARLQAVKCSPDDGLRSTPSDAMVERCPPFLLTEELSRLRPAAVVGFGADVFSAFERLGMITDGDDYLAWGRGPARAGRTIPVFWLYHPAGRYWTASHAALLHRLAH